MLQTSIDNECPVCLYRNTRVWNAIPNLKLELLFCPRCLFVFQPSKTKLFDYCKDYYDFWDLEKYSEEVRQMKILSANIYLQTIQDQTSLCKGRLLDVGCAYGFLLEAARSWGYQAYGVEVSPAVQHAKKAGFEVFEGSIIDMPFEDSFFDVITLIDVIEHIPRPRNLCYRINKALKPGGVLFIITPNVFSLSRRVLSRKWFHFKNEHISYFSPHSLSTLLVDSGFKLQYIGSGKKYLSYRYIVNHFLKYNEGFAAKGLQLLGKLIPPRFAFLPISYPTEMMCIAVKT